MSPRRRSLHDLDDAAIADQRGRPTDEQTPQPDSAAPPTSAQRRSKTVPPDKTATQRVSIYLRDEEFEAAKAAYLADWRTGGQSDTFSRWVAAAVEQHAHVTPNRRAAATDQTQPGTTGTRQTRSFALPKTTVQTMETAIEADQALNRWQSNSEFCAVAVAVAVETARQRVGNPLPTPPSRLPKRLARNTTGATYTTDMTEITDATGSTDKTDSTDDLD